MQIRSAMGVYSRSGRPEALAALVTQLRQEPGEGQNTALLILKMLEESDPQLQSELGDCYYLGEGLRQDQEKALVLFRQAKARGSVRAHYDLGWYHYDRKEYAWAQEMFRFCVEHRGDLTEAQVGRSYACLGDCYSRQAEPNLNTAIENLVVAADKYRDRYAARRLAHIYGQAGSRQFDGAKALAYYRMAAELGDLTAVADLSLKYLLGDGELGIEPDGRKAEELLLPHTGSEHFAVLRNLGLLYMNGDGAHGMEPDFDRACTFFEAAWKQESSPLLAADLGYCYYRRHAVKDAERMLKLADEGNCCKYSDFLGRLYLGEDLGAPQPSLAMHYFGRAFDQGGMNNVYTWIEYATLLHEHGDPSRAYAVAKAGLEAHNDVAFCFIVGELVLRGVVRDALSTEEAAELLRACIRHDTKAGRCNLILGQFYQSTFEFRRAEYHYQQAFRIGEIEAAVHLGFLYERGGGTIKPDAKMAYDWFTTAAQRGSARGAAEAACFKKSLFKGWYRAGG